MMQVYHCLVGMHGFQGIISLYDKRKNQAVNGDFFRIAKLQYHQHIVLKVRASILLTGKLVTDPGINTSIHFLKNLELYKCHKNFALKAKYWLASSMR